MSKQFNVGEYEDTALEKAFEASATDFWESKQIKLKKGYQVRLLMLQFDLNVAMSGGAFAEASFDKCMKLISSLSLELDGKKLFSAVSGDELAAKTRALGEFGKDWFCMVRPKGAAPTDGNNVDFHLYVVLMGPDCLYQNGDRVHQWPSDVLRHMTISLETAAASAVDANATFTGDVRVKAYGSYGGDMILAPLPKYRRHANVDSETDLRKKGETIRALYAYDASGFASHAAEQDTLEIDGMDWFPNGHTVGEIQEKQEFRETLRAGQRLDTESSTGAKTGVTATTYDRTTLLEYVSNRGDLGDSPFHQADEINFEPGSARDLRIFSYEHIDSKWINRVQKLIKKTIPSVEKAGFNPGQWEGADVGTLSTIIPVRIGRHVKGETEPDL